MLHVLRVALAFLAARAARLDAGLDDESRHPRLELSFPAEDISGRRADVRAVEVQANAADKRLHPLLPEARVRARGAALRAVVARLDTAAEDCRIHARRGRMRFDELLRVGHGSFLSVSRERKPGAGR